MLGEYPHKFNPRLTFTTSEAMSELIAMTEFPKTCNMEDIDLGMTNFDGTIDEGFAEALQASPGKVKGRHAAWDFNGQVFFYNDQFHEEVWIYGSPILIVSADTLPELMREVCETCGYH